jgi:hypothetical protein
VSLLRAALKNCRRPAHRRVLRDIQELTYQKLPTASIYPKAP